MSAARFETESFIKSRDAVDIDEGFACLVRKPFQFLLREISVPGLQLFHSGYEPALVSGDIIIGYARLFRIHFFVRPWCCGLTPCPRLLFFNVFFAMPDTDFRFGKEAVVAVRAVFAQTFVRSRHSRLVFGLRLIVRMTGRVAPARSGGIANHADTQPRQ